MTTVSIDAPESRSLHSSTNIQSQRSYLTAIKTVVWVTGTLLVCLALFDFYAQTYANETGIALEHAKHEKLNQNKDLRLSEIAPYISGSPTVVTRPADRYKHMCKEMKQYTWKGFFKNYSISVYIGLGENPSIDYVHGPGDLMQNTKHQSSSL